MREKSTNKEQNLREGLLKKCYQYLFTNFGKFNQTNKIKVALSLTTKDLTQKVEHSGEITLAQAIKKANTEG